MNTAERARFPLAGELGGINVERCADGVNAMLEMQPAALLLTAGAQMGLVAGTGFEPVAFGLLDRRHQGSTMTILAIRLTSLSNTFGL